jgi:hypothetical protein
LQHFVAAFGAGHESFEPFEGTGGDRTYAIFISMLAIFVSVIVRVARKHTLLPWQEREHRFGPREHRFEAQEHRFEPRALRCGTIYLAMVRINPIF